MISTAISSGVVDYGASKEASNKKSKAKSPQVATGQGSSASALPADPPVLLLRKNSAIKDDLKAILILLIHTTWCG